MILGPFCIMSFLMGKIVSFYLSVHFENKLKPLYVEVDNFIKNEIFPIRYEEDDINKLPESSIRPIARTALAWDQVSK